MVGPIVEQHEANLVEEYCGGDDLLRRLESECHGRKVVQIKGELGVGEISHTGALCSVMVSHT